MAAVNDYRPFGSPLAGQGGSPYGFTGEWWEGDAGLLFLRARYLQPETGRFISRDPWPGSIWQPGTLNKFNYIAGNPVNKVDPSGKQAECPSHHNNTSQCHHPSSPSDDPLTPHLWHLSKEKAQLFQIPVELLAGTIATEIVHDTQWHDPILDILLEWALEDHFCRSDVGARLTPYSYSSFSDGFLTGYEHYWGLGGGRGPGPGVANVHAGTAKDTEEYFATHYPDQHLLDSPSDQYVRLSNLLYDDTNVHYAAAILRRLADLRKGENGKPLKRSHLHDLDDWDMQIIYGAFRAGIDSYGSVREYQASTLPGDLGKQIAPYLPFYRNKLRIESAWEEISKALDTLRKQ